MLPHPGRLPPVAAPPGRRLAPGKRALHICVRVALQDAQVRLGDEGVHADGGIRAGRVVAVVLRIVGGEQLRQSGVALGQQTRGDPVVPGRHGQGQTAEPIEFPVLPLASR
ncbi:hypothetical protein [Streptomyces sp. x-19]|uniref:hypothetical protein n=1 Tax=Streptomyces sp. x-19 TaxID=2789280 RepID=UPI0039803994